MGVFQVLFLRWVLTVFDMIDSKDNLRAVYGFIFHFVTEENLVCAGIIFPLALMICLHWQWIALLFVMMVCFVFQSPYICHLLYLLTRRESGKWLLVTQWTITIRFKLFLQHIALCFFFSFCHSSAIQSQKTVGPPNKNGKTNNVFNVVF